MSYPISGATTDEAWAINGVSLHQYGWNIATFGGSRFEVPERRGENIKVTNRPGARFRPKLADSHTITLLMWVSGMDPATGGVPADQRTQFNDSWDFLRRLLWTIEGEQFTLTRRWRLTVDGQPTIVAASALGELAGTMTPTMTGRTRADFQMDILLADPYFYGDEIESPPIPADGSIVTVTNPGYDVAAFGNIQFDLNGPLTNPRIINTTTNVWTHYNGTIPVDGTLRFDVPTYVISRINIHKGFATSFDYQRYVNHYGRPYWMGLTRGVNDLQLTADAGSGNAVVRFQPPYV